MRTAAAGLPLCGPLEVKEGFATLHCTPLPTPHTVHKVGNWVGIERRMGEAANNPFWPFLKISTGSLLRSVCFHLGSADLFLQASEQVKKLQSVDNCWVQRPLALQCSSNQHGTSTLHSGLGQEVKNTTKFNYSNSAFGEVESNYWDFGQNICLDVYALAKMLWDFWWQEVVRILVFCLIWKTTEAGVMWPLAAAPGRIHQQLWRQCAASRRAIPK